MPLEDQAKYSGRGRGDYPAIPAAIFGALTEFFRQKLGRDETAKIVEAINDKASQARLKLKRKGDSTHHPRKKCKVESRGTSGLDEGKSDEDHSGSDREEDPGTDSDSDSDSGSGSGSDHDQHDGGDEGESGDWGVVLYRVERCHICV